MELYRNDYFYLFEQQDLVYLHASASGFALKDFGAVLKAVPRIEIKQFTRLQMALQTLDGPQEIGVLKPEIECIISADKMECVARIHLTDEEFAKKKEGMSSALLAKLEQVGVTDGILGDVLNAGLVPRGDIVVAKGVPPVNGRDAEVRYYELCERKPRLTSDGRADFYDMSFIDEVAAGAWLGEKTAATDGVPGRTVTGKILPALKGHDKAIRFDSKTVVASTEGSRVVLRALLDGAVHFLHDRIGVLNRLHVPGDVGVETGNIDFKGSVVIQGTVQDTFSVTADKDIAIIGEMGVGAVDRIVSRGGDIFIRGGVFGQGRAVVEAKGNVFVKHANECLIHAGEEIHIGYYSIGSRLSAKVITLDKDKGKLIGGEAQVESRLTAGFIGNAYERATVIKVAGFNREEIKAKLNSIVEEYKKVVTNNEKIDRLLEAYEACFDKLGQTEMTVYDNLHASSDHARHEITRIEKQIRFYVNFLKMRGEGEVSISRTAYPNTHLKIKRWNKKIEQCTTGTFYVQDDKLFFE